MTEYLNPGHLKEFEEAKDNKTRIIVIQRQIATNQTSIRLAESMLSGNAADDDELNEIITANTVANEALTAELKSFN